MRRMSHLYLKGQDFQNQSHGPAQRSGERTFRGIHCRQTHGPGVGLFGEWKVKGALPLSRLIVLCILLGALILSGLAWREVSSRRQPVEVAAPTINKLPVNFENRTFDPGNPPADMGPLAPGKARNAMRISCPTPVSVGRPGKPMPHTGSSPSRSSR